MEQCPSCHAKTEPGFHYCPACGRRMVRRSRSWVGSALACLVLLAIYGILKDNVPVVPVAIPPSSTPTRLATHTQIPPSPPPTSTRNPCLDWREVTTGMAGQSVCVYGVVVEYKEDWNNQLSRIHFGTQDRFFLVSTGHWYTPLEGECVQASGKVELNTYKVPYIKVEGVYILDPSACE